MLQLLVLIFVAVRKHNRRVLVTAESILPFSPLLARCHLFQVRQYADSLYANENISSEEVFHRTAAYNLVKALGLS